MTCQGLDRQGQGPSLQGPGQGQGLDFQGQGLTSLVHRHMHTAQACER